MARAIGRKMRTCVFGHLALPQSYVFLMDEPRAPKAEVDRVSTLIDGPANIVTEFDGDGCPSEPVGGKLLEVLVGQIDGRPIDPFTATVRHAKDDSTYRDRSPWQLPQTWLRIVGNRQQVRIVPRNRDSANDHLIAFVVANRNCDRYSAQIAKTNVT